MLSGDAVAPDRADLQQEADNTQEPDLDEVEIPDEVPEHADPPGEEPYGDFVEWEIMPYDGPTWAVHINTVYDNGTLDVCETPDGGFVAAGWAAYHGWGVGDALWVYKLDAHGRLVWQNLIVGDEGIEGKAVHCMADGTSLVMGTSLGNLVVAKLDDSGRILWSRGYNVGYSLQIFDASQGRDGKIALAGIAPFSVDIINMTESGDLAWARAFSCPRLTNVASPVMMADGGCVVVARRGAVAGEMSMVIFRLAPDGALVWQKILVIPDFINGTALARLPGEVFAATVSVYGEGFEAWDVLVLWFNDNGDILNAATYGGRDTDVGVHVRSTAAGNVLVTGYTESFGAGDDDSLLMMLDPAGRVLWARTFGLESWDQAWDGLETSDGGLVVNAATDPASEEYVDAVLLKLDPNGLLTGECPTGFGQEQTLQERSISLTEAEPCLVSSPLSVTEVPVELSDGEGLDRVERLCEP